MGETERSIQRTSEQEHYLNDFKELEDQKGPWRETNYGSIFPRDIRGHTRPSDENAALRPKGSSIRLSP